MDYKLELKPFQKQDGVKYIVLKLTDVKLHTRTMDPSSIGKNIKKSLDSGQAGRIYSPLTKPDNAENMRLTILDITKKDPVLLKAIQDYEKKGYKVLIQIPKAGLPIYFGEDAVEFLKSKNGQRVIRGLAKDKSKD